MALVISIDDVITHIWKTGSLMLAVAASIAVVSLTETYLSTAIFSRMGRDIRNTLFEKSQALTIDQFNRFGPASMITRSTNDIMQIQMAYMAGTEMILPAPIMAIAGLILAFSKSPSLAAVIILSMLIVCIFTVLLALKGDAAVFQAADPCWTSSTALCTKC